MATFIKKGKNKAKGKYIYPEPTQTNVGNCAAYAATSCLYAFGLDHNSALHPRKVGKANKEFDYAMRRMVEELTSYIYTKKLSVEAGIKRYLKERSLDDDFEVNVYQGNGVLSAGDGRSVSVFDAMLGELARCQNVLAHLEWSYTENGKTKTARHAITLTGFDRAKKEVIAANPWGSSFSSADVPPDKAGKNTADGKTVDAYDRYKYSQTGTDYYLQFHGHRAKVYQFVKVCPKEGDGTGTAVGKDKGKKRKGKTPKSAPVRRFSYSFGNSGLDNVNAFAVSLPGVKAEEIASLGAPPGWSCSLWYHEHEAGFAFSAPERYGTQQGFAGVIWRAEDYGVAQGLEQDGFFIDVLDPSFNRQDMSSDTARFAGGLERVLEQALAALDGADAWVSGSAACWLIEESEQGVRALCELVDVPAPYSDIPGALHRLADTLDNPYRGGQALQGNPLRNAQERQPDASRARESVLSVEGVDHAYAGRLSAVGVDTLSDLAKVDVLSTKVRGVSAKRLGRWVAMASVLLRDAQLSGNDAEILVKGLGMTEPGSVSERKLKKALGKVKLPREYDLSRVRGFLELPSH